MPKDLLVGSTGFVGGNLKAKHDFCAQVHSADIQSAYGMRPDVCVYAGVPAAMFLANADPEADLQVMRSARENLRRIMPDRLVLISSIAVYPDSRGQDEDARICPQRLPAYGKNRLQLEQWVREDFPDALIVRLPALYGLGLKKNFLFDLHTITPAMLREEKYLELAGQSDLVGSSYRPSPDGSGFYRLTESADRPALKSFFESNAFNALSFTDSRSRYQFYHLSRLWSDIQLGMDAGLRALNLTTPPVSAAEVYEAVTGNGGWKNEMEKPPFDYDLHSRYAELLGGKGFYLCTREQELEEICSFMKQWEM